MNLMPETIDMSEKLSAQGNDFDLEYFFNKVYGYKA